jgi:hypothetical protein
MSRMGKLRERGEEGIQVQLQIRDSNKHALLQWRCVATERSTKLNVRMAKVQRLSTGFETRAGSWEQVEGGVL